MNNNLSNPFWEPSVRSFQPESRRGWKQPPQWRKRCWARCFSVKPNPPPPHPLTERVRAVFSLSFFFFLLPQHLLSFCSREENSFRGPWIRSILSPSVQWFAPLPLLFYFTFRLLRGGGEIKERALERIEASRLGKLDARLKWRKCGNIQKIGRSPRKRKETAKAPFVPSFKGVTQSDVRSKSI